MGIIGKLETDICIKSSGDLFHELFGVKPHHVSKTTPKVRDCKLHGGEFGDHGSIIEWHYTHLDGKECVAKCEVVKDEEKKLLSYKVIEGTLLEEYKTFTANVHVIPKGEVTVVKWFAEFEMLDDGGTTYPTDVMDFWISITKDIEAHHLDA